MQLQEPLHDPSHHGYKKIVLTVGILLLVIVLAIIVWYWYQNRPMQGSTLTQGEREAIVQDLNTLSEQQPRTYQERYQMVTGRALPETKAATSTQSAPKR